MLTPPYDELYRAAARFMPAARLVTDPLRLLAYGTDASFYRLVPKLVAVVESEAEILQLLAQCRELNLPVTFRTAGTSLSGQAVTDSVLILFGDNWSGCVIGEGAETVRLQPGLIGAEANRRLAPHGRKIGPDPASINAAKIGGIAANNASGMCCGTAQNSYQTLAGMRVVLADGTVLDTGDQASVDRFRASHAELLNALAGLAGETRANESLAERIRRKFAIKNTTGYSLNALIDFVDPIDILTHLMIGSEGTLGCITEITYRTVPEYADKASGLVLFDGLETACRAVTLLKDAPVAAVELMDRAALKSVEDKPGLPAAVRSLPADGAALLIEIRAASAADLGLRIAEVGGMLLDVETAAPVVFERDPQACERLWNVRKGTFPSVGAIRELGTTVIIEDVAFPVPRLAEATLDLQRLLHAHGYHNAIIFGHALAGNLHFVFTQDFNTDAEVARYARFMDEVCKLVVEKYDGSLKAEHGTGRNMAPFVELEWGSEAHGLMRRIKQLFDPAGLLNPGVILNDDPEAHLKNLKPLPPADPRVDACIECGFCEPLCPSRGLTLSPRQRIVGWREIARLERAGEGAEELRRLYDYQGIDTCAACGLCATACPVYIEAGGLIKALRGRRASDKAHDFGSWAADHFSAVTGATRASLGIANGMHALMGSVGMAKVTGAMRSATGGAVPRWTPCMPRPAAFRPETGAPAGKAIVYFPSCAARTMGPARGDEAADLPTATERLMHKAGFTPVYPKDMANLCCGQPFESKGLADVADRKAAELEAALLDASDGGRLAIVFDTSPCAWRMKRFLNGRLPLLDISEFLLDHALPRLKLRPVQAPVALHLTCSTRKQGLEKTLEAVARACAEEVVMPAGVTCCGFAGDKGFTVPELNAHALRHLPAGLPDACHEGYSTSRTCEIGLSERSGRTYRSIVHLVERAAEEGGD